MSIESSTSLASVAPIHPALIKASLNIRTCSGVIKVVLLAEQRTLAPSSPFQSSICVEKGDGCVKVGRGCPHPAVDWKQGGRSAAGWGHPRPTFAGFLEGQRPKTAVCEALHAA